MPPPDHQPPDHGHLDDHEPDRLDRDTVADPDALAEAIAAWVQDDADAADRQQEIDDLLSIMRSLCDDQQWDLVQQVLGLAERRHDELAVTIAMRAFEEGLGSGRVPEDTKPANDGLPHLDEHVLGDSTRLGRAIDAVLRSDQELHDLSGQILRAWDRVRRRVDDEAWKKILAVEEVLTERASVAQEVLVVWAFRAGARSVRQERGRR